MEIAQAFSLLLANNTLEDGESMLDYFIQLTERNFIQAYHTILICSFQSSSHHLLCFIRTCNCDHRNLMLQPGSYQSRINTQISEDKKELQIIAN